MDPLNRRILMTLGLACAIVIAGAVPAILAAEEDDAAKLEELGLDEQIKDDPGSRVPIRPLAVVEATVVVQDGDNPPGATGAVDTLSGPYTNGDGEVGFVGDVVGDDNFVWFDTGIVWKNSDGTGLTGGEATMGVGNNAEFIYSPSINGDDGAWTQNGQLAVENTQAPGFPAGINSTFHSRPTMTPSGAAYWVAGFNDGAGGTSTVGRMLYTSPDGTPGSIAVVIQAGDSVDGFVIDDGSAISFDYEISDNTSHHVHVINLDTGSTSDDTILYVDGSIAVREGQPTGDGDNWDNWDYVSINNNGDYVASGDTDGATETDEFVQVNDTIALREGDTVDGILLESSASGRGTSINNLGQVVHSWSVSGGTELIFFACDAADLSGTSQLVLATGDMVDLDGDTIGDATVTDYNNNLHNIDLSDDGRLFVEVDLDYGSGDQEAIIALDMPSCDGGPHLVINEIDYDQASTDTEEFIEIYNGTGSSVNLDDYQLELVNGSGGGASIYVTIDLPDFDLADDDYYVVCANAATVPFCDLDVDPDTNLIQNGGPDAVALRLVTGELIDAVSYEGDTLAPYTEGSGIGLEDDPGIDYFSVSRYPNGVDTDQNNIDLSGRCNSPGLPNFEETEDCEQVPVELQSFTIE